MRLSWATAIVVLAVSGSVAAQGPDAGPEGDAAGADAGDDQILETRRQRIRDLEAQIAYLEARISKTRRLGPNQVVPGEGITEGLRARFDDPESVSKLIADLRVRRRTALAAAEDLAAVEAVLLVDGGEADGTLWELRLTAVRLEQAVFGRQAGLARAQIEYLELTQPARAEGKAFRDDRTRSLHREKLQAQREEHKAEAERRAAVAAQSKATTEAEFTLSQARTKLKSIAVAQKTYETQLVENKASTATMVAELDAFRLNLIKFATRHGTDAAYEHLSGHILTARMAALEATSAVLRGPKAPAMPSARLSRAVRALAPLHGAEVEELELQRRELRAHGRVLEATADQALRDKASVLHAETLRLTARTAELLPKLSSDKLSRLRGFDSEAASQVRGETLQVVANFAYRAGVRLGQIKELPATLSNVRWLGKVAWLLFQLGLLVLLLRFSLRHWDMWMLATLELIGHSLQYGGWSLWLARVAESARHFGPSLLFLGAAIAAYRLVGGVFAPPEVQVAYVFAFWMAALRCQLRVIESLAKGIGQRWRERRRAAEQEREDDREDKEKEKDKDKGANDGEDAPTETATELFAKTWRRLTRYVAVFVILLELTYFAVDRNVFFGLLLRFAWLGAIPLFIFFLRTWRPLIIREYLKRSSKSAPMRGFTERHSRRFYGLFIVGVAFVVVVVRQIIVLFRDHLSNLESTKRLLAFLFRRRVEKHARDHGRVLDRPHELPNEIISQFPNRPLTSDDGPMESPLVPKVAEVFERWCEEKVEGSVVLVGARGMGRTTTLNLLATGLGQPICYGKFADKLSTPEQLVAALAKMFAYELDEPTEKNLINEIYADDRQIFAVDDCHNLFLRKVGGFAAWETFTRIVNQTCKNVFWVLTLNDAAWDYLNNISENVAYYRKVFEIPAWSETDIRKMILARMRRAGYKMNFTDLLVTRLEGVNMSSQIIRTSHGYFRLLWDFTDGNPRLATFFWLRSLVPDTKERRVRVHLFKAPRIEDLQELPDDIAFVLTAVAEHENVTAAELSTITGLSEEFCRFTLSFCRERGYLTRNAATGRTHLSFHWQQTIIRYLKRKHLLYS